MSSLHALFGSSIPPSVVLGRSFKQDQQRFALRFDGPIQISEGKSEKKLGLGLGETSKEVMELEGRVLVPTYARAPVVLERGEGCKLYDINGREYLDMTAGIAVNSLGHGDPDWVKAVVEQARTLTHVSNVYYSIPQTLGLRLAREVLKARVRRHNQSTKRQARVRRHNQSTKRQ